MPKKPRIFVPNRYDAVVVPYPDEGVYDVNVYDQNSEHVDALEKTFPTLAEAEAYAATIK